MFRTVGLLYIVLAIALLIISLVRRTSDRTEFADDQVIDSSRNVISSRPVTPSPSPRQRTRYTRTEPEATQDAAPVASERPVASQKLPPASKRLWSRRPFVTSGRAVVSLSIVVLVLEAALLALILRLPDV